MSNINGMPGTAASTTLHGPQQAAGPAPAGSATLKINYGDPARASGLQNTLNKMQQLTLQAQSVVQARNTSLQ